MSTSVQFIFVVLYAMGYIVAPLTLAWGWLRWAMQPSPKALIAYLSLIGFVFATASGVLAFSAIVYAQIHNFRYYDPLLLKIFRCGILLSITGILFGAGGLWRKNSLRWHAPVSALATLAFWFAATAGE
jgi:hypothetical protein